MADHQDSTELLLSIARFGFAHSFYGQLYESVVDVPARIAGEPLPGLLATGSPARYFLPAAPVSRAALLAGVVTGWKQPARRRGLAAATVAAAADTAVTVHLVRSVNPRLFVTGTQAPEEERRSLLRRWHRLNLVRLAAESVAWLALADTRRARGPGS